MKLSAAAILSLAVVLGFPGSSSADPPVIAAAPSDLVVEATGLSGRAVSFAGPSATDDNGMPVISCNPASGTLFPVGTTQVTCVARDPVTGEQSSPVTFSVRVLPRAKERASKGAVSAFFYYRKTTDMNGITNYKDVRLTIVRSNRVAYDAAVRPYPGGSGTVWPGGYGTRKSVSVRDLDGDGEPEVLLDLYWGGAHCCWWTDAYRHTAQGGYLLHRHFWGDELYELVDLNHDGRPEFKSADDRFAYAFASFADSGFPVQIWSYRGGRFADVTRRFPAQIRRDAAAQWRYSLSARRQKRSVRGLLAAWAADECLLHRCSTAFNRLRGLAVRGRLTSQYDQGSAKAYLRKLKRFLRARGYVR